MAQGIGRDWAREARNIARRAYQGQASAMVAMDKFARECSKETGAPMAALTGAVRAARDAYLKGDAGAPERAARAVSEVLAAPRGGGGAA